MPKKFWFRELFIDPSSGQPSMSRTLLPWVLLLDAAWVLAVCYHIPKEVTVAPVSSMLGLVTGAVCGIYGLSTFGGSLSSVVAQWTGGNAPKAVKANPNSNPRGE